MKIFNYISLFVLSLCMIACSENDGPYADEFVSYDIVQLVSASRADGTVFSIYKPGSDKEILYTDARGVVIDTTKVPVGNRMLLGYVPETTPYVTGKITATGYTPIHNDTIKAFAGGDISDIGWNDNGIYVYSVWRMGPFLNIHGKVTYSTQNVRLMLLIDQKDLKDETPMPNVYLTYMMDVPADNFEREFYASFYISPLWDKEWIEGFALNVNNTNLPVNIFKFEK